MTLLTLLKRTGGVPWGSSLRRLEQQQYEHWNGQPREAMVS